MNKPIDYMNVKTCDRCGKIFETFLEMNYCPVCHKALEVQLDMARRFMQVNETTSMEEISVALKVEMKQLVQWVRERRLEFTESSGVTVPCMKCRTPIQIGKYCATCKAEIMMDLESVYEKPEISKVGRMVAPKKSSKMHYLNRRNKR